MKGELCMAYVSVPKDLTKVKEKFLFNLTQRQVVCFGSGALVGLPVFFLLKTHINVSLAAIVMILCMLPFFLFAMYEKNGQPLEKVLCNIYRLRFTRPKNRPYQTDNFYAAVDRQIKLDKEVKRIAQRRNVRQ